MKKFVMGILAHVDSGKTTLSEGLLFESGAIQKLGRVDHKNAFLDTNKMERDRGITIFSKQAVIRLGDAEITLLDTPGHVDFSAETERALCVLDYAILVVSGSEGIQSHTETLWRLLEHYGIPVFIFINKMDLEGADKENIMEQLHRKFGDACIDFTELDYEQYEAIAMISEEYLNDFLETEKISDTAIQNGIAGRRIFPCFFGSALKMEGVDNLLSNLDRFSKEKSVGTSFSGKVFKIADDEKGQRLTFIKVNSGNLKVKESLLTGEKEEKVNEIRVYSGAKYSNVQEALPGGIYALTGLSDTYAGQGFGTEQNEEKLILEPVFTYTVILPKDVEITSAMNILKKLSQEETQLRVSYIPRMQKIEIQVMGEVQLEILKEILAERFNLNVEFEEGNVIYKETIADIVEGVGHYEPLRHYAEVHLKLEPLPEGSGVVFGSKCSEDMLDRNWQRLIMSHLSEKQHLGVLTGAPITDIKITLMSGRAHQKHTEGGDFREATYRAVRQGLMRAKSVLLEPWFKFILEVPISNTGRAMTDLQQMGAELNPPDTGVETTVISGKAPVKKIRNYHRDVIAYTHGVGRLHCSFSGYFPCRDQDEIVCNANYNPEADLDNTPDSVFCSHGSGFTVKWTDVFEYMHLEEALAVKLQPADPTEVRKKSNIVAGEEELLRIFEQTYGKIKRRLPEVMQTRKLPEIKREYKSHTKPKKIPTDEYLLIDGYNIIFAWDELKKVANDSLEEARGILIDRICGYQAMRRNKVIIVFDAYKVKGGMREIERYHGVSVIYTKEAETADAYIEKTSRELIKDYKVRVATSDSLEQIIIFGNGAERIPAGEFLEEVRRAEQDMRNLLDQMNKQNKTINQDTLFTLLDKLEIDGKDEENGI